MDANGRPVMVFGDVDRPVYPRSAIKPFQALRLVRSGAIDRFNLGDEQIALACASHAGEPRHVGRVVAWLDRIGLDETALACGPHPPSNRAAAEALIKTGQGPGRVHNNCSGKHTGLLSAALAFEFEHAGYDDPAHPLQQMIEEDLRQWCEVGHLPKPGIDGCGLPNWPLPLANLALGFAKFARAAAGPDPAVATIAAAMRRHPELVAGDGRLCTTIMRAVPGVLAKTGAEGVYGAALLEAGFGVALKVRDGATRASRLALLKVLEALRIFGEGNAQQSLAAEFEPKLSNFAGSRVGHLQLSEGSLERLHDRLPR